MSQVALSTTSKLLRDSCAIQQRSLWFVRSALLFRLGLALVTFEQIRPYGVMPSDFCFFLSLLFLKFRPKVRLLKSTGSGVLMAGALILSGALLSLHDASKLNNAMAPLTRLFILFVLFGSLAVIHSENIRKNLLFLIGGIALNCAITLLQAWVFPGIVDMLSINPVAPDTSEIGRFQGLTAHTVTLGLSAALAVLIAVGLISSEKSRPVRGGLLILTFVCALAAVLSGSRIVLASLIPAVIVFAVLQRKRRGVALRALVAVVIVWGAVTYFAPGAILNYSDRLGSEGVVDYGRLLTAATALEEISQKPILGWGIDRVESAGATFFEEIGDYMGVHNTFLAYWNSMGLLGAVGFLVLFIIPTRNMLRMLNEKLPDDSINTLRLGLASYVFLFIVSNLGPYIYSRFLYVPMFVFAGFAAHASLAIKFRKTTHRAIAHLPAPNIQATS